MAGLKDIAALAVFLASDNWEVDQRAGVADR
jgi:hypothetical protein